MSFLKGGCRIFINPVNFIFLIARGIISNFKIITIHLVVWLIVFGINYVFLTNSLMNFDLASHLKIWTIYVIIFYINYSFLMPVFLFRKNLFAYFAGFLILFGSSYFINQRIVRSQMISVIRQSGEMSAPGQNQVNGLGPGIGPPPPPGSGPAPGSGPVPGSGPAQGNGLFPAFANSQGRNSTQENANPVLNGLPPRNADDSTGPVLQSVSDLDQIPVFKREDIPRPDLERMVKNGQFDIMGGPGGLERRLVSLYGLLILFFSSISFRFIIKFQQDEKRASIIENERISTELSFLKQQINPHFLFNSLNNIYSLTINKPEIAPEAILKLSSILRYMLYEAENSQVFLKDEIKIIQDYIELQKMRLNSTTSVICSISGYPGEKVIAPFILIPLVENAFKYGVDNINETFININIIINENEIKFLIRNKKLIKIVTTVKQSGIGIKNIKRRLNLLYFNKHSIEINDGPEFYTIYLELPLL